VCLECGGVGHVSQRRRVELKLPPTLRDGLSLRLQGLGEPGEEGGEPGDLYLTLRLVSDPVYRCSGSDIEADVPVAPWEAQEGAQVTVRTLDGPLRVKVPPDTPAGTKLRLRGKGLDDGHGGRGDFYAVVRIALPELNSRQRELLRDLARAGSGTVTGGAREGGSG